MGHSILRLTLGATLATILGHDAWACGGTFCSNASNQPLPVDQSAERIVFEVEGDRTCAHVQVDYEGEPEEFAWIIPVPRSVEVTESTRQLFFDLASQTTPTFLLPSSFCGAPTASFSQSGGGCFPSDAETSVAPSGGVFDPRQVTGVDVLQRNFTDSFEWFEVQADETDALVNWLRVNQFNVSDNMRPGMDPYVREEASFLAVKLRPERGSDAIPPIRMCYQGPPSIPIRLTAVAARPHMGIQVYVLGTRPHRPRNYAVVEPDPNAIMVDGGANVNYFDWVARVADEAENGVFVPQFVGPLNRPVRTPGGATYSMVSRYYTRLSPEKMDRDPVFEVGTNADLRTNQVDLRMQPSPFPCPDEEAPPQPSACAFNYCGIDGRCTEVDGQAACACPEGQVADEVRGPDGRLRVTCVPAVNPLGITPEASGVGTAFDPCLDADCGAGSCVVKSGFATCECSGSDLATVAGGRLTCAPAPADPSFFGPGAGVESRPQLTLGQSLRRHLPSGQSLAQLSPWMVLALWLASARRRRRR